MDTKYIYKDWYVLQVRAGREMLIKQVLEKSETIKFLVFFREIIHLKREKKEILTLPVFPGYIFIHEKIKPAREYLRSRLDREFLRPVAFNGEPAMVGVKEMEELLYHTDNTGKFSLSTAMCDGGSVIINQGPLKNMKGKLLFINKKKRKAKVRISLFKREFDISLGIDWHKEEKLYVESI